MPHTPGPWVASDPIGSSRRVFMPDDVVEIRAGERGGLIAAMYRTNWGGTGQDAGNARLIAAAPQLLEALQAIADYYDEDDLLAGDLIKARAAIALATGGK